MTLRLEYVRFFSDRLDGYHGLPRERLPQLATRTIDELLMFFQVATGYAGVWYGVDPFDQPGVELGKILTYGAMGRPGFEDRRTPPAPDGDVA